MDITPWHLVPGMALGGLGMGMVAPTLTDFVLAGVPEGQAGAASGVLNTIFQVGARRASPSSASSSSAAYPANPRLLLTHLAATEGALWCEVAVFALTFLLVPLLPRKPQVHTD
jgi:hypothetical protein